MWMPNLFFFSPVEMYGWVFGSTSGFTRRAMGAFLRILRAMASIVSSSCRDSTLNIRIPLRRASSISPSVFPTPEYTIFPGGAPAARARESSPPETMSTPLPRFVNVRMMEPFGFAFME